MGTRAEKYRDQAKRIHAIAVQFKNEAVKSDLEKVAAEYEVLARQAEKIESNEQTRSKRQPH